MKRLIFTLLYEDGYFMYSRNFRLQRVGDINWLLNQYNFFKLSGGLDEIIIINISKKKNFEKFYKAVEKITTNCFIPVTVGGRIENIETAYKYFDSGADKLLVSKSIQTKKKLVSEIANIFGKQSLVGCLDYTFNRELRVIYDDGKKYSKYSLNENLRLVNEIGIGELILQSKDYDGTGKGLHQKIIKYIDIKIDMPIIYLGGIGKEDHIIESLKNNKIDSVATANLFNFINSSFNITRKKMIKEKINILKWDIERLKKYKDKIKI